MKKGTKITLLIILIIAFIILNISLISRLSKQPENPTPNPTSTTSCVDDADCVPAQCCHPTSCINKNYKGVCNLLCTQQCSGPIDCGMGSCGCVNGKCEVVPSELGTL